MAALLPLAALAGLAHAAPQNLGGVLNLGAGANANAGIAASVSRASSSVSSARASSSAAAGLNVPSVNGVQGVLPVNLPASAAVPAVTGVAVPSISGVAIPSISGISDLTGIPAVLVPSASLPTGSLPITIPTTVPVTASSIIASLGSLPGNAQATSAVESVLAGATSALPPLPTDGLPIASTLDINDLIDSLGDEVFDNVASSFASLFASVTSAAGSAIATPDAASVLSALQALPTGEAVAAVTGAAGAATSATGGLSARSEEEVEKRQVGLSNLLGGITPGSSKANSLIGGGLPNEPSIVTTTLGGLTNGAQGLGAVTNVLSSATGLLSTSSNPLSLVQSLLSGGALSAVPGLGGITDSLPIGSVVTSATGVTQVVFGLAQSLPLPPQFSGIISLLAGISSLDLNTILSGTVVLTQIEAILSMGSTLAALNPSTLGSLATLTNLGQMQSLALVTDTFDLATIMDVLTSTTANIPGLSKRATSRATSAAAVGSPLALGTLIAQPTAFFAVIEALQPQLSCLPCVVSVALMEQSGLLGVQNLIPDIDTSAVSGVLANIPVSSLTSALPSKE